MRTLPVLVTLLAATSLGHAANIIQELSFQGHFSTLLDLVSKTGLTDPLSRGIFTMFAPTDTAFAKLPASVTSDMDTVRQVLMYHIAAGQIYKANMDNDGKVNTLQGVPLRTNVYQTGLTVNGKPVEATDLSAGNGVIHVMHDVIYPIPNASIADVLANDPRFTTLVSALSAAGLSKTVSGTRPVTLFAPTNEAFNDVDGLSDLMASKKEIRSLLQRHLMAGVLFSAGISDGDQKNTMLGSSPEDQLDFALKSGTGELATKILVDSEQGEATVIQPDIVALNGVIHAIDTVI